MAISNFTWQLRIKATPTIAIDNVNYPITHDFRKLIGSTDSIKFDAELGSVKQSICFDCDQSQTLNFTVEEIQKDYNVVSQDHFLKLTLAGKTDQHTVSINSQRITWELFFEIIIEDLPIDQIFKDEGQTFLPRASTIIGQNGYQTLKITTPIYRWLLDRYNKISQDLVLNIKY